LYVAVENCEIVWVVVYKISEENCEIVVLCAKNQHTWVGRRIIRYLEEICHNQHITKLRCRSFAEFVAQWFYKKMWFEEQYLLEQQFYWCDTRFFWKIIKSSNK
jgi:GNAT superfamily N-acetyltransferase